MLLLIVILRLSVVLESLTRFVQELRRDADIVLGGTNVNVAQIRGQLREQSLHVGAGSIPRDEPMLDGCVSNIVDARLAMRPSFALVHWSRSAQVMQCVPK